MPAPQLELPQAFGPYTLLRRLAKGGMGELYLAQREGLAGFSKQLVVKRIRPELATDDEFVEMFLSEGRIAALLDHPNIVHIFDLGQVDGIYYMAMEYIAGHDLGTVLMRRKQGLDLPAALHVMHGICEGLAFAHDARAPDGQHLGVVHRDINPHNVLISFQGAVSITDFGIAKARIRQQQTRAGVLKGKFGYLAPEQARTGEVDRRTDIYTLGLLLFEITTGRRAIPGRTDADLLESAANGRKQQPSRFVSDYPAELEQIFERATAKRKDDRFQTVRELQEALLTFQVERRLMVTAARVADLMQETFPQQVAAMRPSPAAGPLEELHSVPTVLKGHHDSYSVAGAEDPSQELELGLSEDDDDVGPTLELRKRGGRWQPTPPPGLTPHHTAEEAVEHELELEELTTAETSIIDREVSVPTVRAPGLLAAAPPEPPDAPAPERSSDDWTGKLAPAVPGTTQRTAGPWSQLRGGRNRWLLLAGAAAVLLLVLTVTLLCSSPGPDTGRAIATTGAADATAASPLTQASADAGAAFATPLSPADADLPDAVLAADLQPVVDQRLGHRSPTPAQLPPAARPGRRSGPGPSPSPAMRVRLRIECSPTVQVLWRGKSLGTTPLSAQLPPGRQRLVLRNTSLGIGVTRWVTVPARGSSRYATKIRKGRLLVRATPRAAVTVDGTPRGSTPTPPIALYEGPHLVLLKSTTGKRHAARVVIRPGKTTTVRHRF